MLGPMRYVGYGVAVFLGLVVLLVVGTSLAVRLWGPELARERVEALRATLARDVRVDRVDLEPWRGRVVVAGVAVPARPGEPGPHLLTLPRVEANIGIGGLWHRRLVLRSVRLDDLDLRVRSGEGPPLHELPILPEVVRAGPLEIALGPIELRRARLLYEDDQAALRVAPRQGLSGSAQPGRQATRVTIAADEITIEARQGKDSVGALTAEVRIAPTAIEIRDLGGTWQKHRVTVVGTVRGPFDAPALDLTGRGEIDLGALGRRLGAAWTLAGVARSTARLQGSAAAPHASGNVSIDELRAGPVTARSVVGRVALDDEDRLGQAAERPGRSADVERTGHARASPPRPRTRHAAAARRRERRARGAGRIHQRDGRATGRGSRRAR